MREGASERNRGIFRPFAFRVAHEAGRIDEDLEPSRLRRGRGRAIEGLDNGDDSGQRLPRRLFHILGFRMRLGGGFCGADPPIGGRFIKT
jgi:hypothetical protein